MDRLGMSDRSNSNTEDFEFLQSAYTHQPPMLMTEGLPMMFADPPLDQSPMQNHHPRDHSKELQSYIWTDLGLQHFNPNATPRPLTRDDRAESSSTGYLGSGHNICPIPSVPLPSTHEAPQSETNKDYCLKGKKPRARGGVSKQKQVSYLPTYFNATSGHPDLTNTIFHLSKDNGYFLCDWKDCAYSGIFSSKGALMRHIDTQHVAPRSVDCPKCDKLFSRKDNMTEHLGRVHRE